MGADKPQLKRDDTETRKSFLPLLLGAVILLTGVVLFSKMTFKGEGDLPKLNPQDEAKLQKRLNEIDDAEQYALVANENGWYPCNHPGRATFHLFAGEIWKYGTTTKGRFGRYSIKHLEAMNVSYIIQFQGTISECLKEEQCKLFNYPYLPENIARPERDRLPRPLYNSKMQ